MTYMQYRLVLICFLLVFIVSALSRHFIQIETIAMLFPVYAFVLTCWLLLFFFLLYARKNLQLSGNETFAPAKVLSAVVAMLVFVSIAYPVAMSVVYKTVKDAEG